ncbi:MAG: hypothetical protein J0L70_23840 [Leptolyngbya sp. UWPOB_LEPTO1]|uniref:hypothetical protein n=1 Tax=Leptolyngbya sp. UWPOB_LEPTO1 TaxID=2815653 RepID=UPI001AD5ECB9|nr:hypothetical protein [Leptolyngbya sp. UWPOB_LEPTO1]MBN8563576.1 hypothetical protein [Leptolyngbya sp. UWPOB_LEPTO1]
MEPLNSVSSKFEVQPVRVIVTNPNSIEPPSAWMQYGTSPTEIILAIAIVITSLAGMIGAIALLVQVLVPVMRSNSSQPKQ